MRSRFFSYRQIARNAKMFNARVSIIGNGYGDIQLTDEPSVHGHVTVIGPDYLRLTDVQLDHGNGTCTLQRTYDMAWGTMAGIMVHPDDCHLLSGRKAQGGTR